MDKTKIAFLQYDKRARIGIGALSAILKKNGHETDVFTSYDKDLVNDILKFNPKILGLSSSTTEHTYLYNIAEKVKERNDKILVVLGGPHATFFPEEIYKRDVLDVICRGEADNVIVELANRLEKNEDYSDIPNLWVRKNGEIIINEMGRLIENLDELPFPDRDIYYKKYPELRERPTKTFVLGRGCPFNCSYCFNHQMRQLYQGKGQYVRLPSVDYAIRQIKDVQDKYGFEWVQINDDTININKKWISEFLSRFKHEIGVHFVVNLRIDALNEELTLEFIDAGIDRANFGVEHGNEKFRREILNRDYSNDHFLKIAKIFRDHNIRMTTSNIVGFPGESLDLAFDTVELNRKIKPEMTVCFILVPYPKTDIYNYCIKNGYLKDNVSVDNLPAPIMYYFDAAKDAYTIVKLENETEMVNLHKFFNLLVKYESLEPLIRELMKLPPNRFYDFISQIPIISQSVRFSMKKEDKIREIRENLRELNINMKFKNIWINLFDKKILTEEDITGILMMLSYQLVDELSKKKEFNE